MIHLLPKPVQRLPQRRVFPLQYGGFRKVQPRQQALRRFYNPYEFGKVKA